MITINNGTTDYDIDEQDVLYFYKHGLELRFVNTNSNENIVFTARETLRNALDTLLAGMHRQLATIPAIILGVAVVYWINCANLQAHSVNESTITLNYGSTNHDIECISSAKAVHHNNYLSNRFHSNHLSQYTAGRRFLYVNPRYTNNKYKRQYSSWENALAKSKKNDVIYIEAGDYSERQIVLKDRVDTIIEKGTTIRMKESLPVPAFWISQGFRKARCKVFGEVDIISSGNGSIIETNGEDTDCYFEFNSIENNMTTHTFHQTKGRFYAFGRESTGVGVFNDSDDVCASIDLDVLSIDLTSGQGFFPDMIVNTEFYLRNHTTVTNGNDWMYLQAIGGAYDIELINCKTNTGSGYGINTVGFPHIVRVFFSDLIAGTPYENNGTETSIYIYDEFVLSNPITTMNTEFPELTETVDAMLTVNVPDVSEPIPLWSVGAITIPEGDSVSNSQFDIEPIPNAYGYELWDNGSLIASGDYFKVSKLAPDTEGTHYYRYRAVRDGLYTEFSNPLKINIMSLTNKPRQPKYTIGDTVYFNNYGEIQTLTIKEVRAVVQNPDLNNIGVQYNYYKFDEVINEYEQSRLFASKGSLLARQKGDGLYLNDFAFGAYEVPSLISDLAGFNYTGLKFNEDDRPIEGDDFRFDETIIDRANFQSATMPTSITSKEDLIDLVASYDKRSTIWTDGRPIIDWNGLKFQGNDSGVNGFNLQTSDGAVVNILLKTRIKGQDWTIQLVRDGALGMTINAETRAIVITYVHETTNNSAVKDLLNANATFLEYFNSAWITGAPALVTAENTQTYYAWLRNDLTGADMTGIYAGTTDFSYATMPTNADTKAEFKALVAEWDPVTTIWTDGNPIGE